MRTAGDRLAERGRFIRQTYRELVELVPRFQAALARVGLRIQDGTPLDELIRLMTARSDRWD
jgi:hypothetical protein